MFYCKSAKTGNIATTIKSEKKTLRQQIVRLILYLFLPISNDRFLLKGRLICIKSKTEFIFNSISVFFVEKNGSQRYAIQKISDLLCEMSMLILAKLIYKFRVD
jgi:hypothetical protein